MASEYAIELGDVTEVLRGYRDNSFDAIIADPPYGIRFMGKGWDYDVPQADLWREVLRVCKPGAALIAFSGTRTYHRTVVQIEDAGWEIRDTVSWNFGSGFPKSLNVSKAIDAAAGAVREVTGPNPHARPSDGQTFNAMGTKTHPDLTAPSTELARAWAGYGTALKPGMELACLARKPLDGTVAQNVAKWGVGALAIDASRIGRVEGDRTEYGRENTLDYPHESVALGRFERNTPYVPDASGRWPANVILDEAAGAILDAQSGDRPGMSKSPRAGKHKPGYAGGMFGAIDGNEAHAYGDSGGASRFFYCCKASRKERDAGLEGLPTRTGGELTDREDGAAGLDSPRSGTGRGGGGKNTHACVKPLALMQYLARLIMPPNPGAILVPFAGSGSEMIGCLKAGWPAVLGIERESEYVEIARARLAYHTKDAA